MDSPQQRIPSRVERYAPLVAGLCIALPNVLFHYPPMVDLPHHEGMVALLRGIHDPTVVPEGVYQLNIGHSNQLFYFVAWLLSFAFGVELACKVVVAVTLVAILLAGARLAAYLDASRWVALLLAPVAIGWLYLWGMIANLMGLAALLAMLPTLDRLSERPSLRTALAAVGGAVLVYECHELMLILYAGAALIFAAGHVLRPRETLLRLVPFLAALGISVGEQVWTARIITPTVARTTSLWAPVTRKIFVIDGTLYWGHEPQFLIPLTALTLLALLLILLARLQVKAQRVRLGPREFIHRYRFELFGGACFLLYLGLPMNVHGATMVYHRFLAPAYAVLVVCLAPRGAMATLRPLTCIVLASLTIGALFIMLPLMADVSTSAGDLDKLMAKMGANNAVACLDLGPNPNQVRNATVGSMGARVLTARGGRLLLSFAVSPISPVIFSPQYDWDEPHKRMMFDHFALRPAHDFTRFRYLLIHTASARLALGVAMALAPQATLVESAGDWSLFESKLQTVPLKSVDVPLPVPAPESLGHLLRAMGTGPASPLNEYDLPQKPEPNRRQDGARSE